MYFLTQFPTDILVAISYLNFIQIPLCVCHNFLQIPLYFLSKFPSDTFVFLVLISFWCLCIFLVSISFFVVFNFCLNKIYFLRVITWASELYRENRLYNSRPYIGKSRARWSSIAKHLKGVLHSHSRERVAMTLFTALRKISAIFALIARKPVMMAFIFQPNHVWLNEWRCQAVLGGALSVKGVLQVIFIIL